MYDFSSSVTLGNDRVKSRFNCYILFLFFCHLFLILCGVGVVVSGVILRVCVAPDIYRFWGGAKNDDFWVVPSKYPQNLPQKSVFFFDPKLVIFANLVHFFLTLPVTHRGHLTTCEKLQFPGQKSDPKSRFFQLAVGGIP